MFDQLKKFIHLNTNAILHRKHFDVELGPGTLGHCEDTLFALQVAAAGFKIIPSVDCVAMHFPDVARYSRNATLEHAKRQGRSQAYIDHHWRHITRHDCYRELLWYRLQLVQRRLRRLNQLWVDTGCDEWEYQFVCAIAYLHAYLKMQSLSYNYEQYGLTKIGRTAWHA